MQETPAQEAWDGFVGGNWQRAVDVRDFIQKNYTPYDGDDSFLAGPRGYYKALGGCYGSLCTRDRKRWRT